MRDTLHRRFYTFFIKPVLRRYLSRTRNFNLDGLSLKVYPGVFHPAYFFSSGVFSEFIKTLALKERSVCDVGCGSGILGLMAYQQGARVTSLDISASAVNNTRENFINNFGYSEKYKVLASDLFSAVADQCFDFIFINPPYFFKDPATESEYAWYCGKNGEYFKHLFSQLSHHTTPSSKTYIILADNCDLAAISAIAGMYNYSLNVVREQKVKWEKNYIFSITISNG